MLHSRCKRRHWMSLACYLCFIINTTCVDATNTTTSIQNTAGDIPVSVLTAPTPASMIGAKTPNNKDIHKENMTQSNDLSIPVIPKKVVTRPYFDDASSRNISAVVGQTAILKCRVRHVGDRTVSWMRKRDLHILTSNIHTYTGDGRFSVVHDEGTDEWNLKIEFVQKRDAGVYECQVNTEPKINMALLLNVDDAQAIIQGPEEVYVKKGSTISLTCTVNVHSTPPGSVVWYQGNAAVDFESSRGGISLETEKTEAGTTSKLLVTKASLSDSGNYTCLPSNAKPASVFVHVLNGEHPAAMQHGEHNSGPSVVILSWTSILVALAFIFR